MPEWVKKQNKEYEKLMAEAKSYRSEVGRLKEEARSLQLDRKSLADRGQDTSKVKAAFEKKAAAIARAQRKAEAKEKEAKKTLTAKKTKGEGREENQRERMLAEWEKNKDRDR